MWPTLGSAFEAGFDISGVGNTDLLAKRLAMHCFQDLVLGRCCVGFMVWESYEFQMARGFRSPCLGFRVYPTPKPPRNQLARRQSDM